MKASSLFRQYVWLVDTISRAGRITLREINDRWLNTALGDGIPYSRSTFRRHRQEVEEMFGIAILCDSENRYYIDEPQLMHTDSVPRWMLSTLTVSNIVSEARGLHDRILLESTASSRDGDGADNHLRQIVAAMKDNRQLQVSYRRYGSDEPRMWTLEPYCIKLFRRRWYLLGHFPQGGYLVLSFDRILALAPTDDTFCIDPHFDAETFFAEYYGVMTDDRIPLQRIVLRAYGNERFALRDLPLHPSQRTLAEGDGYVDFEVRLRPTSDFLAQILSRGRWLKVISPEDIALQIKSLLQEAVDGYK